MWCPGNTINEEIRWWLTASGVRTRLVLNGVVEPDFNNRMSFDATTGILTIHEAHLNDSGVYWCSVGFETFEVQLTVFGKLKFSGNNDVLYTCLSFPRKRGSMFLPTLVCVSVCVSVCDHDNKKDCGRICAKFYGKVPRGKGRPSSCFVAMGVGMWK